jgi:hypothetical protein
MINICRSGADLLDTIAEECFHLHQDVLQRRLARRRGPRDR